MNGAKAWLMSEPNHWCKHQVIGHCQECEIMDNQLPDLEMSPGLTKLVVPSPHGQFEIQLPPNVQGVKVLVLSDGFKLTWPTVTTAEETKE